jgi:signal transduction histidine kinase
MVAHKTSGGIQDLPGAFLRRSLIVVAALVFGAGAAAAAAAGDHADSGVRTAILTIIVGSAFVASGLVATARQPENRSGLVMIVVGFAWFAAQYGYANQPFIFTLGTAVEDLFVLGFAFLILTFPSGQVETRLNGVLLGVGLFAVTVLKWGWLTTAGTHGLCGNCPQNLAALGDDGRVASAFLAAERTLGVVICLATLAVLARRWRQASRPQRRAVTPVLAAGCATFATLSLSVSNDIAGQPLGDIEWMWWTVLATVPLAYLAGVLRLRLHRGAITHLVADLPRSSQPTALRALLAQTLDDPSLALAYYLPEEGRYVDETGAAVDLPGDDAHRATTIVENRGVPTAALVHDPALRQEVELLRSACAAAALALDNARLQAELRARLEELRASRARIVEAGDAERRRIERNLHDGTQQQLVSIAMALGLAEAKLAEDTEGVKPLIAEARIGLSAALAELRAVSQGIHPGILTERGLDAAVNELALRSPVPVEVISELAVPPPDKAQAGAYYVVCEALANVAKHAEASVTRVRLTSDGRLLRVEIIDDGIGGVDRSGSGVRGLADRVEALGGRFSVASPVGRGTVVRAELPCA